MSMCSSFLLTNTIEDSHCLTMVMTLVRDGYRKQIPFHRTIRIHLREIRLRSWIDSNAQEILSTSLRVFPIDGVSDWCHSLARSTFNAPTMETIERCVTWWTR